VNIPGRPVSMERGVVEAASGAHRNSVGEGFFETLGIPLVAGRTIERRDIRPNAAAVVVDELFARRFFPGQNPLGRRFGLSRTENNRFEIVGVVRDSRYNSLRNDAVPTVYEPLLAGQLRAPIHFAIRAGIDSGPLAESVRKTVAFVDPAVPLTEFHTQTALIDRLLRTERLLALVAGAFGLVALTLAAVGIGGLLAYTVARRTNVIGVRMAMGAAASDVIRMVLRDSLWMVGTGLLIGLPSAYAIGRVLKSSLFRLEPLDPVTAALSLVMLVSIALLAAWIPARRAARIDPMVALRAE
jgi:predicted permease